MKSKDNNIFIDVDETLIRISLPEEIPDLIINFNNEYFNLKLNHNLINKIKNEYSKKYIIIWTSNSFGESWAKEIVNELGLNEYIDLTLFKPTEIIDDSPLTDWFINIKKPPIF